MNNELSSDEDELARAETIPWVKAQYENFPVFVVANVHGWAFGINYLMMLSHLNDFEAVEERSEVSIRRFLSKFYEIEDSRNARRRPRRWFLFPSFPHLFFSNFRFKGIVIVFWLEMNIFNWIKLNALLEIALKRGASRGKRSRTKIASKLMDFSGWVSTSIQPGQNSCWKRDEKYLSAQRGAQRFKFQQMRLRLLTAVVHLYQNHWE